MSVNIGVKGLSGPDQQQTCSTSIVTTVCHTSHSVLMSKSLTAKLLNMMLPMFPDSVPCHKFGIPEQNTSKLELEMFFPEKYGVLDLGQSTPFCAEFAGSAEAGAGSGLEHRDVRFTQREDVS